MIIGGYQKLTLIDYPKKLATTVFTVGCSFRCPFCHNPELIEIKTYNTQTIAEKEFFDFLKKRKGKLEGVCITGGEPLIQPDIIDFIKKINKLGYSVKLDTNGTRPDVLKKIIDQKLVDYIAMDIKNSPKRYDVASGVKGDMQRIKLSVDMIMNSGVDYEFRTTVVPGIHTIRDFDAIAKWIKGAPAYYLQEYREIKILDPKLKKKTKGKKIDLDKIKKRIEKSFEKVGIRR
ncbi:molybdenum cofactor biosynthesis protein A [bacterium BMS3Abin15]|nr:molybdenum cofactor biosynthesis protein A [bacterium BMS3Abin15]HDH07414.1 anaerobic ribonucleoside-triphosphate reductase activating protein [Candidatus Moranbacteria bacterium]HDZ85942.1 anaerobic ribonucleoside-triphosphate reductase activating protein [Candidatus Moranbacteria bacterium]